MVVISILNILIYLPLGCVLFMLSSGLCLSLLIYKMEISDFCLISWYAEVNYTHHIWESSHLPESAWLRGGRDL